jgi:predicted Zn-dependent peptidase
MAGFATYRDGRCTVHILSTSQFHTRHVNLKVTRPLHRETVTATAIIPYLWMEGTRRYPSAKQLIRRSEELFGTVLQTGVGKRGDRQLVEVYAGIPEPPVDADEGLFTEALDLSLALVTDPAVGPDGFPELHVERERALHRKRIASVFDDKIAYALERCLAEVCAGRPEALPRFGFEEDLNQCTPSRLWQENQALINEADVHLYVVGRFEESEPKLAERLLAALKQRFIGDEQSVRRAVQPLPVRTGDVREVVDEQPVQQGKLNLGLCTGISYADPDYPALLVCNGILGGFPHSKLFRNVRERASLAYYASSRVDPLTGIVSIQTGIEVANYQRALAIIREQVQALKDGQVSEDEMEFTKRGLRNQYQVMLDQPMTMADVHFLGVLSGTVREVPDLLEAIANVSREDVVRVAERMAIDTVYFLRGQGVKTGA